MALPKRRDLEAKIWQNQQTVTDEFGNDLQSQIPPNKPHSPKTYSDITYLR